MRTLLSCVINELNKIKGSFNLWFSVICATVIPLFVFIVWLFNPEKFVPLEGENSWSNLFYDSFKVITQMLFNLYTIITVALIFYIEHKNNSWKTLLVLPISRVKLLFSKIIFVILQIIVSLTLFILVNLLFGFVLGVIKPEFGLFDSVPETGKYVKDCLKLLVSCLGVIGVQLVLSFHFKNIIVPICAGICLSIVGGILAISWEHASYFPYSFQTLFSLAQRDIVIPHYTFGYLTYQLISPVLLILLSAVTVLLFNRKKI